MSGSAELGSTSDPVALIPGDPGAVHKTQLALTDYGDLLHATGEGLARIDTDAGWHGTAGDQFRAKFHGKPQEWTEAGQCFHAAAGALVDYAATLTWAQAQAADAIALWAQGEAATATARAQHDRAVQRAQADYDARPLTPLATPPMLDPSAIPFIDPGAAKRRRAQEILDRARTGLQSAGDTAERIIDAGRDKAPEEPDFWDDVGDFLGDAADDALDLGSDLLDFMAQNGPALFEQFVGAGLIVLGAGGEILGFGLDLTGVGAAVGLPVGALSAGVIATGVGLAGHGYSQMAKDGDGGGGGGTGGEPANPRYGTKVDPAELKKINPSGSKTNCVACSSATDDLIAGKGPHSVPDGPPGNARDLERAYGGQFDNVVDYGHIKRLLADAGTNARAIISRVPVDAPGGRGHVFNAYVDDLGHVKFIDGQTGLPVSIWPSADRATYKILWTNRP